MSKNIALELISSVFPDNPGIAKADVLYDLARGVDFGAIVEIGSSKGYGTVALALGTLDGHGLPVYSIDPNEEMRGWSNEPYGPDDRVDFMHNILVAGVARTVRIVNLTAAQAGPGWDIPVSLLFWDIGTDYRPFAKDFWNWTGMIQHKGILAVNETGGDKLSADELLAPLVEDGLFGPPEIRYYIRVLERL